MEFFEKFETLSLIQNKLLPPSSIIGEIYKDYDDEDGFLYIEFCEENTFGDYSHP